ncbi:unnamed protein product [Euphydryas editha]|uniref:Arginine kinase n=1 Tax=Euphydryas editha TaxID=104508 RepID=A0AAU9UB02_EUPED|nr:unnamed protein product [Euphydryas editha]
MENVKRLPQRNEKQNGLFIHSSHPKVLGIVSSAQLRQWARCGGEVKLERAILAGQGHRLLTEAEAVPLSKYLVNLITKCKALHNAVEKGSLLELQELMDSDHNRHKYVACLDEAGVGLLHKAVFYSYKDIIEWLVNNYPQLVHQKDSEGRTPLHYTAACRDEATVAALLERAGADRGARDVSGRTLAYYRTARTSLALPDVANMSRPTGLVIKRHNIRIWCHECDMGRLQRVVWEGQGARLLSEVSSQPIVKKFLEAVPYIMNTIRDIHNAVIQNDLEGVMKLTSDPIPPQALSSRDANNLTALHKAAGLGHGSIMKYIIERYPQGINDSDNDGRTPLHYAAVVKDDQHTYNTLISLGADEGAVDNKNKTPAYYINRPQEIDKNLFKILPEAPRTPSSAYPASWDWKILDTEFIGDLNKKSRKKHLKASSENISSKNNTNTISDSIENMNNVMKNSSTHELISDLPDLNDSEKLKAINKESNEEVAQNNKDTTEIENSKEKEDITENVDKSDEKIETPTGNIEDEQIDTNEVESIGTNNTDKVTHDHTNDIHEQDEGLNNNSDIVCQNSENHETENIKVPDNIHEKDFVPDKEDNSEIVDEQKDDTNNEVKPQEEGKEEGEKNDETITTDKVTDSDENEIDKPQIKKSDNSQEVSEIKSQEISNTEVENENENENTNYSQIHKETNNFDDRPKSDIDEENNNEEDAFKTTPNEGNASDNAEDDDDVQVHGNSYPEHNDIHTKSATLRQSNGSAKRGNFINDRNTQESLIEGIISSEAEQETQDASITQRDGQYHNDILTVDNEIDPEVTDLINTANMEMLATLVLNGEGSRLIGRQSRNTELQAFLNNVPTYMQKINKVHIAAREGNLKDLQAALDRRKFAIARDPISPNGATPLHVATVFGKSNIMKYLGGRFPETLSAVDFEGRTSLHYAAVLPDNGHYYNVLQQLGANSKDLDDNGRSAEDYLKNPNLFPFKQMLTDFGISDETADAMFSDKVPDDHVSSRRVLDVPESLETLERCYRLLASAKPARTPLSASSNNATPPHVLGKFLKKHIFDLIKYRTTKLDHNLFDVIWPAVKKLPDNKNIIQTVEEDFPGGVSAPDYYVYEVFAEFLLPLIKDMHNMNIHSDLPDHPTSDFIKNTLLSELSKPLVEINIDPNDEFVLSGTMECSRNLDGFELPLNLKVGKLESVERIITTMLMREDFSKIIRKLSPESDHKSGTYYTMNEVLEKPSEISAILASAGLLIPLCDRDDIDDCNLLHGRHWPYARGVFVSDDKSVAIWINVHDHLRVLISTPFDSPGDIGLTFSKLSHIMTYLHNMLDFVWDQKLGHLSSRPTFLGAGIRFSLIVNIPGLAKDSDNIKHLCTMRGLQYRETLNTHIARISNYQCLCITESNCFNDFTTAASNLLHLEKDLAMQNSAHIATMLSNIFKRKRSSLADIHDSADKIREKH